MRALLRVLAPLLGIALAAVGMLLVIEVVAAWLQPTTGGTVVPWPQWRAALEELSWQDAPVPGVAIGVGVLGLALVLVGLLARRSDVAMDGPDPAITVTTSSRVLAQLVGRRVRATEDLAGAAVTASRRRISVTAQPWGEPPPGLDGAVADRVEELLDQLPLHRRPAVSVAVATSPEPKGPR